MPAQVTRQVCSRTAPSTAFFCALILGVALGPVAQAQSTEADQEALNNLAQELVVLRSEIETLNAELTDLTAQHRATMSSLAAQKGELEASKRPGGLAGRRAGERLGEQPRKSRAGRPGHRGIDSGGQ